MANVNQAISYLVNFLFAYTILVGFMIGLGLDIGDNHQRFIRNPIIQIIGGFVVVKQGVNSTTMALVTVVLFYLSTLAISNDKKVYYKLLGPKLGEICAELAEDWGFLEEDPKDK